MTVHTGAHYSNTKLDTDVQERKLMVAVTNHNDGDETGVQDIALVKLDRPVIFGPKIKPICLPLKNAKLNDGQKCKTAGWGRISDRIGLLNDNLKIDVLL